jgi:D-glycero-D-manno-heptose 1,7-bisphosphate phosphatase
METNVNIYIHHESSLGVAWDAVSVKVIEKSDEIDSGKAYLYFDETFKGSVHPSDILGRLGRCNLTWLSFSSDQGVLNHCGEPLDSTVYRDGFIKSGIRYVYPGAVSEQFPLINPYKHEQGCFKPALFLDRDGIINEDSAYLSKYEDLKWMPGIVELIKWANDHDFLVFVVSNQSGVARGYFSSSDVELLHGQMDQYLKDQGAHVTAWQFCTHHKVEGLESYLRKPAAGMVLELMEQYPIQLTKSFFLGDKVSDRILGVPLKAIHLRGNYDLSYSSCPRFGSHTDIISWLSLSI